MHVGIVTPAFNVAPYIGDAIRSVLSQIHRDWTMTIVDDGSTDETAAAVAGFADPRLRLIRQCNEGVSAARNRGMMATTRAEAVLLLDADDWLSPNALSRLTAALRLDPVAIAAVGPYLRVPDGRHVNGRAGRPASGDLLERLLVRNLFANGGHLLIRRHALEAAGLFDPRLSYGEDWEFWTRLALLGPFVSVASPTPVLYVRERLAGAYLSHATDPAAYRPAIEAIYHNAAFAQRLGATRIAALAQQAEAEIAWTVGRELIRNGRDRDGRHWLRQSIRRAPGPKRLALLGLGWLRLGQFRPYQMVAPTTKQ
jgi:glycosyltransferase involved in cell wall biosynthesis